MLSVVKGICLAGSRSMVDTQAPTRSAVSRYIALFLWLLATVMFFSLAWQWIGFTSSDKQLTEYAKSILQRADIDRRSAQDVQSLLLLKAERLSIPVQPGQIQVRRQGETL